MAESRKYDGLEIAIIGMAGQFPQSNDCIEFWQNLSQGICGIRSYTDEELKEAGVPQSLRQNPRYVKAEGNIEHKDIFDHGFFGYTAEEAALMDPQIRIFHEYCWKALEDGGYTADIEKKKIGLFAGASTNDNWKIYVFGKAEKSILDPFYLNMIKSQNFINTMVSYKLNLRGPSVYVDTACSTSLAAVHLACRSLLTRECVMALAGGICVRTNKQKGYLYQDGMIASTDGYCRTFDAASTGTASGEGTGVVLLKRLSEAIRDRDVIYAVIRATVVNNDGNYKVGYTAPSVKGQSECISLAHKLAGIEPQSISYIEAHGTGTKLGDPVEVRALNEAFKTGGQEKFCAIGSVKTNIGHADAAAGIAGLIKTALSLKYKKIPPSLHFREANPEIDFAGGPFYVNTGLQDWEPAAGFPRRAGVSSFGIGGTNVHAILEEAPEALPLPPGRDYKLLLLSAKTPSSLSRYRDDFIKFLEADPLVDLGDAAYTLQVGRRHFLYRQHFVYKDRSDLLGQLQGGSARPQVTRKREYGKNIVLLFPGQGSQYADMCRSLYHQEPLFSKEIDQGFLLLDKLTGISFRDILFSSDSSLITETRYAQPLIFLVEYSLARLLTALGIRPRYMIGHSIGEYTAACIAGVFSFEDGLKLVVERGRLMNSLPPGGMVSVPLSASDAAAFTESGISLAGINGPEQVVFSGDAQSIESLCSKLSSAGIPYVKLHTSHAFHSAMQEPIMDAFKQVVEQIKLHAPELEYVSNLTGKLITASEACSPGYWSSHLRETVQYSVGLQTILSQGTELLFIEAGAGHSLTSLLKQHQYNRDSVVSVNLVRSVKDDTDDGQYFLQSLGQLWSYGAAIDWQCWYGDEQRRRVSLPTYSFEPVKYPAEVDPFEGARFGTLMDAGKNVEMKDWLYYPVWKQDVMVPVKKIGQKKGYLFFTQQDSFSDELCAALVEDGSAVIVVFAGEEYKRRAPNIFTLNPASKDHFKQLIISLNDSDAIITDVVYGWGISADENNLTQKKKYDDKLYCYFGLVHIVQSLLESRQLAGKNISVLTDCLHKVIGNECTGHEQSLLLGLVNVLPQEYAVTCSNIDIDSKDDFADIREKLLQEIRNDESKQHRITAFRYGQRWIREYQKNTRDLQQYETAIRKGGVYLITGGLGNTGLVLASYLLTNYKANVIVTGRRSLEAQDDTDLLKQKLETLRNLGGNVHYYSVDVANENLLRQVVGDVENTFGAIHGVIHTAGVTDDAYFKLVEDITADNALAMFAPKVKGIVNIHEIFAAKALDFVWKCVGFSGLGFTEDEAGSGALMPREITALFEWSIAVKGMPLLLQSKEELSTRMRNVFDVKKDRYLDDELSDGHATLIERPELSADYAKPETETEAKIKGVFENLFGIENIGVNDDFFELGGDSLKGMILIKRISREFGLELALKDFFANPTIKIIAERVDEFNWLNTDVRMDNEIII
jgi:acyl transferase domain-containing protein/acyl carrier protein